MTQDKNDTDRVQQTRKPGAESEPRKKPSGSTNPGGKNLDKDAVTTARRSDGATRDAGNQSSQERGAGGDPRKHSDHER